MNAIKNWTFTLLFFSSHFQNKEPVELGNSPQSDDGHSKLSQSKTYCSCALHKKGKKTTKVTKNTKN